MALDNVSPLTMPPLEDNVLEGVISPVYGKKERQCHRERPYCYVAIDKITSSSERVSFLALTFANCVGLQLKSQVGNRAEVGVQSMSINKWK